MRKFKLFNGFVLGLISILILAGCESKVLIATPTANAGPDQNVAKSATVNLDGSGSTDPNADPLTYLWTMTDKPPLSTATLSSTTVVAPTFTADLDGTYTITLVVSDGATNSGVDTVVISVSNTSPVAVAGGPSPVDKHKINTVALNSVGSMDANGDPITYLWTMTAKPLTSVAVLDDLTVAGPTFEADLAGTYSFSLVVNDGTTDSNTATVDITAINTAPVGIATISVPTIHTGQPVTLDGSTSTDINDDFPLSYAWVVTLNPGGDTLSSTIAASPTFTPTAAGNYEFSLVVTDNDLVPLSSSPVTVALLATNTNPVAEAGPATLGSHTGAIVLLDGSGSSDAENDSFSYLWSATGPGTHTFLPNNTSATPTITTDADGVHIITLTVTDIFGGIGTDTITLTTVPNTAPTANIVASLAVVKGTLVSLDGGTSTDPELDALTYAWTLTPPAGSSAVLSDATAMAPTFTADYSGDYIVDLVVNDGALDSAPATVTITASNTDPVADAGVDQIVVIEKTATLEASLSTDANGDTLTYNWTFASWQGALAPILSDNNTTTAVAPTFVADELGVYTIELIVVDDDNLAPASSPVDTVIITAVIPAQDTGQTGAGYTSTFGEDSDYSIFPPLFTDNSDGTVTDERTDLIWQQSGDLQIDNWYGATGTFDATHNSATTNVCGDLVLAGHPWRLPTQEELSVIVNYGTTGPAVDLAFFPGVSVSGSQYWALEDLAGDTSQSWLVDLSLGGRAADAKTVDHEIKCVSGGPLAVGTDIVGAVTVTDGTTSLVWQKQDDGTPRTWEDALVYCEGLDLPAGTLDWRLPSIRELASITDVTASSPAISPSFVGTVSNHYWSSTTDVVTGVDAWVVNFSNGDIESLGKSVFKLTRCVRGGQ